MRAAAVEAAPAWTIRAGSEVVDLDADGTVLGRAAWNPADVAGAVSSRPDTRWVWADTAAVYPEFLAAGTRVDRAWDLRLSRRILRLSPLVDAAARLAAPDVWDRAAEPMPVSDALFALTDGPVLGVDDLVAELSRQRALTDGAADAARLRLLLHAESAGALIAAEMHAAGLPWDRAAHERILVEVLGARAASGAPPEKMQQLAAVVRAALGDPAASLDSPPKLLRSLHRVGVMVASTSRWELAEQQHPVVEPLLEYKKMARLLSANGWGWLDEWVRDGRFRPVYIPAGVVTGRWASNGGGALQIPRQLRPAMRADPGWVIVDADVAQLEPRVLAGMSRDARMATAARGLDLYEGIVATGAVATREEAKYAVLGAMYGATSGDSGRLVPRLRRAFPAAMALVDDAARIGEEAGAVSTWLGRGSPPPEDAWLALQSLSTEEGTDAAVSERARRSARDRGRFTRNYIVQGTAAEWALCWLAEIRHRLSQLPAVVDAPTADRSGPAFARRAHLVFFLHDEVIVHAPAAQAEQVAAIVVEAATAAGRRMFGTFPIDFPLDVAVSPAGGAVTADG
ncbi:bifunctional 3'-5' exonuclease/DNA polymerase [Microbacterium sp. NPDC089189]|uniref:bifunctional 3'-5' exonuclease/DNA polymerase n=1 Tax=Microbacterium sp. NPDC089189 TaxID=3154972 RepID=UPI00344938D1